ncbi:unnamed protein product [Macrosiphum euphorbiae]|nr:unnamed protein product [Macrosiphum euphorbiae]
MGKKIDGCDKKKKRVYEEMETLGRVVNSGLLFPSSSRDSEEIDKISFEEIIENPTFVQIRGKNNFITDKLSAALGRCKVSDRDAVHILLATAESFGVNTDALIINRTSVKCTRERFRKERMEKIQNDFNPSQKGPCIVHWDGKLLPSLSRKKLVDRLPVIISHKL